MVTAVLRSLAQVQGLVITLHLLQHNRPLSCVLLEEKADKDYNSPGNWYALECFL